MGDNTNDLALADVLGDRPALKRNLVAGTEGIDVARLQADLRRLGLAVGSIDGIFGANTSAAVKEFQKQKGITGADPGSVDAATWEALARAAVVERAEAREAAARAFEQVGGQHYEAAGKHQQKAVERRQQALPAGFEEEQAFNALLAAGRQWLEASEQWLAAAEEWPADSPEGQAWKAYSRHLRARDYARSYGVRAANSIGLALKDYEGAAQSDDHARLSAKLAEPRVLAAL